MQHQHAQHGALRQRHQINVDSVEDQIWIQIRCRIEEVQEHIDVLAVRCKM
jgi:hypothetical protein